MHKNFIFYIDTLSDKTLSDKSDESFSRWRKLCPTNNFVRRIILSISWISKRHFFKILVNKNKFTHFFPPLLIMERKMYQQSKIYAISFIKSKHNKNIINTNIIKTYVLIDEKGFLPFQLLPESSLLLQ